MTVRITYVNYKEDVAMSMMRNGEDRTASLKAAVESASGKFLGFYGLIGQDYEVVIISEFEKQTIWFNFQGTWPKRKCYKPANYSTRS